MKDEEIVMVYYKGWEASYNNKSFPNWFKSELEKLVFLEGYSDWDAGVIKEEDEILHKIKTKFGN